MSNLIVINNFDDPEVIVMVSINSDDPKNVEHESNFPIELPANIKFDPQKSDQTVNSSAKLTPATTHDCCIKQQGDKTWLLQITASTGELHTRSVDTTTVEIGQPQ
jgi:hypothetical protein